MPAKPKGYMGNESDNVRLLWNPYALIEITRPDLPCGGPGCTLTACLSELQLAVLRQVVALPLQLDWSPFDRAVMEELNLLLFGDQFTLSTS